MQTLEMTDGLCMPCHKKVAEEARVQHYLVDRLALEKDSVELPQTPEEDVFLESCAVHCLLDCCGFDALDISEEQFRRSLTEIGHEASMKALNAMNNQLGRIGDHRGLVRSRGHYEDATEIRMNYESICAILKRII